MRDDFAKDTLETLAKRVGYCCSNPTCGKLTAGPRTEHDKSVSIGVGAHITAASPGGPRYDPALSPEQRKSADNGIWLCQNCAKLVDNDPSRYSVQELREWKSRAEESARSRVEQSSAALQAGLRSPLSLDLQYERVRITGEHHDYLLRVAIGNAGTEPATGYYAEVSLPTYVLKSPEDMPLYVAGRSDEETAFFRTAIASEREPVFPGDTKLVFSIPYYMNNRLYGKQRGLMRQTVRAAVYVSGGTPVVVEKQFSEMQCF